MQLLDRKRWSEEYFASLSTNEQEKWIAWEYQRQERLAEALKEAYKPNTDGNIYAETVTARLMALIVTSGGLGG